MQSFKPLPYIFSLTILSVNLFILFVPLFHFVSTLYTRDLILSRGFQKKIKKFFSRRRDRQAVVNVQTGPRAAGSGLGVCRRRGVDFGNFSTLV